MTAKPMSKELAHILYMRDPTRSLREVVIDLLTDLRHACEMHKLDFAELNRVAQVHYSEEREVSNYNL